MFPIGETEVCGGACGSDVEVLVKQVGEGAGQFVDTDEEYGLELQPFNVLDIEDAYGAVATFDLSFGARLDAYVVIDKRLRVARKMAGQRGNQVISSRRLPMALV